MKTLNTTLLATALLLAACNKSNDVNPNPSSSLDRGASNNDQMVRTDTSGTASHVYLDAYFDDPVKGAYIDVNSSNYVSVLNESFTYSKDLSTQKPFYCSSGDYHHGKGLFVYIKVVCNEDLSMDDFLAKAIKVASKYSYTEQKQKDVDNGIQQNYKLE